MSLTTFVFPYHLWTVPHLSFSTFN